MSQNIVFERATVKSLAQYLYNLRLGTDEEDSSDAAEIQIMQDLIEKYSTFTPHDPTDKPTVTSKTVLVTGTTGGLGSIILANILQRSDVSKVYTLVRADTPAMLTHVSSPLYPPEISLSRLHQQISISLPLYLAISLFQHSVSTTPTLPIFFPA